MSTSIDLPHDVLSYHDQIFYDLVRNKCGGIIEEIFKLQNIRSVQSLLRITNVFDFMNYDSNDLNELKQKVGFRLRNGNYQIKCGILMDVDSFLGALRITNDSLLKTVPVYYSNDDFTISQDFLLKHPIIMSLIRYYSRTQLNDDDTSMSFLNSLMENITQNLSRPKFSYRYNEHVKRFAITLYILAGRNAYEFVRINIPGAFPSLSTIQSFLDEEERHIKEGDFRFNSLRRHLSLTKTNIAFCSEDCTAIVPKVTYDVNSNSFVGFSLPLDEGRPLMEYYQTESFAQLEDWFASVDKSTLLNVHMVQPIANAGQTSSPIILSAYGTNSKYTSLDIIRRWIWIFDECLAKDIRIIGFSTDGDPKYFKAMKLVLGFFASLPNMKISDRSHAFEVSLPADWNWFFLRARQLVPCFQDPTHICTKLRNRLLSTNAEIIIGNQRVSLDILLEMIANKNKLKHEVVKSDVYPRDKQNFASCEKISSNSVVSILEEIPNSFATRLYLRLIRSVIIAYIDRGTNINNRVYHAWFTVFLCRIWWAWLLAKAEDDPDEILSWSSNENSSESTTEAIRRFFITKTSFQSIEINAHQLTYLILLVTEGSLPLECLQIFLFNSQTCESTFRFARAMSGVFSSVVNFSVTQFLRRAQKLSILNRIKNESEIDVSTLTTTPLRFPKHHKQSSKATASSTTSATSLLTKPEIKRIVSSAFDDAFESLARTGVHNLLKKKNIHTFRNLNTFVLNKMNATSKTVDNSRLTDASSDSESDDEITSDDTVDPEYIEGDSDDEPDVYNVTGVDENSFHGVRIVDIEFLNNKKIQSKICDEKK